VFDKDQDGTIDFDEFANIATVEMRFKNDCERLAMMELR
jgi:Ca2+-binding EF-hand superfamily protein